VYLDEVSVYSLLSSRLGAVAAEFTSTETSSLLTSTGAGISAPVGPAKVQIGSKAQATETQGSQVVRKAIIQSQFKELFELERDNLVASTAKPEVKVPLLGSLDELEELLTQGGLSGWVVSSKALSRGQLLEVEVDLEAEDIFRVSAILTTLIDLFKENPRLLGEGDRSGILDAILGSRILDKLLVGLIPLRGRAVNYRSIEKDGAEWLVKRDLLDRIPDDQRPASRPVYVVGVAEADLFWRDIRRVLFSGARYNVMCRVGRDGLHDTWTPVKLVDVLRDVIPDLADTLGEAGEGLLSIGQGAGATNAETASQEVMRVALVTYAGHAVAKQGKTLSESDLSNAGLLSDDQLNAFEPVERRREAFSKVNEFLKEHYSIELPPEVAADLRSEAILQAEQAEGAQHPPATTRKPIPGEPRFLDTEIVAIYW
jgi:hypothetical protein